MKQKRFFDAELIKPIKQVIISHVVMLALFAGAAIAFAQEAGSPLPPEFQEVVEERRIATEGNREQEQAEIQADRVEKVTTYQENLEQRRVALHTRSQERITNLAANISNRIDAVIVRLENITVRAEERIKKLSEQGFNTSTAEAHLAAAKDSVVTAKAKIASIDGLVLTAVSSEDVRANWQQVRGSFTEVTELLKDARSSLHACITSLKDAVVANSETVETSEQIPLETE